MNLLLIVLLPFVGSVVAAFFRPNARNAEAWLAGIVALVAALTTASLYPRIAAGEVVRLSYDWIPTMGLAFQLRMDGFAWLFTQIVTVIGLLVVIYARYYMSPRDPVPRFFAFFLAFMGAMLGVVLSGNLLQLAMFWELTSLASFMLIAYWHHRPDARRGARMALITTGMGGLAMLGGMLLLGQIAGGYDLDTVFAAAGQVQQHPWYPATLALILLGALTKSAQFPFHFWLPHAMAAPTPVSAYLHSATMVKAGVFLLARLWPVLAGTEAWFWTVGSAGLITFLLGGFLSIFQNDMKGVLAYSTISHLGLITLMLGMNSELALVAAVFHILNHATFKASLFMAAGIVDHETGTRNLTRLSGLRLAMPITATLAIVAAAAMAGVPLLNGFISKEMFFSETVFLDRAGWLRWFLPLAATVAGTFSVIYSARFIHQTFFGPLATDLPHTPHDPNRWMLLPSGLLVAACLLVGILPELIVGGALDVATRAILGAQTPEYSLAVWHGLNLPLAMSAIALVVGCGIYFLTPLARRNRTLDLGPLDGKTIFNAVLRGLGDGSDWLFARLSPSRLQTQLVGVFVIVIGCVVLMLNATDAAPLDPRITPLQPVFAILWLIGAACAVMAAWSAKHNRLIALALSGGAGLATSITFIWLSAPDLALTQLAVETATVVLILLGLRWLPRQERQPAPADRATRLRTRLRHGRDFAIAASCGFGMAALSFFVITRPPLDNGIGSFFTENSLPLGEGLNVVNVILVDFRGFDTFGEITVLGVVALTVFALLRRFRPAPESIPRPNQQRYAALTGEETDERRPVDEDALIPEDYMMQPAVLARALLPMALVVSLWFLLRGHNAPGGGFVGGLIFATAIVLQYVVGGTQWVEARIRIYPMYWMGGGLLLAGGAGLLGWLGATPFLTSYAWHGTLPLVGELHLSTVLLFDLGVYMLVVGATVLMLIALAHQSLRTHRPAVKGIR